MAPLLSRQPWKGLYAALLVGRAITTLPWLLVRYSLPSTRPLPEWSIRMCLIREVVLDLIGYNIATSSNDVASVRADHQKFADRFALAPPADSHLYAGVLRPGASAPAAVGGLWYPSPPPPDGGFKDGEKVVLHIPGGAFVLAFGQDMHGRDVAGAVTRHLGASRTFYAQYRLSSAGGEDTRFPAALQDLLTLYRYVLSLGVRPQDVLLSGDSAGGNLVIALLRHLETPPVAEETLLPRPGGALVWSPWVRVTADAGAEYAASRTAATDSLVPGLLQWGAEAYLPKGVTEDQLPYISPLGRPFRTRVPLFVHAGGAEGFYDDIRAFARQMAAVDGNRVKFAETAIAPHDLIMSYAGLALEEELEVAMRDARDLIGSTEA